VQTPVSLFTSVRPVVPSVAVEQQPAAVVESVASAVKAPVTVQSSPMHSETPPMVPDVSGGLAELAIRASTCRLCALSDTRTQVVFGVGNPNADLVFIGEAPGREEDARGEPFVGPAGQLLDHMLAAIGMDRNQVYIMNTIKCRPPNNRDPKADEVQACNLWFEQQLDLLQPKMICLLGRVAAQTVLGTDAPLGSLRDRWHDYHGIPVWVTYHPAYLLRSPTQKQKSWQDLQAVMAGFQKLNRATTG